MLQLPQGFAEPDSNKPISCARTPDPAQVLLLDKTFETKRNTAAALAFFLWGVRVKMQRRITELALNPKPQTLNPQP